MIEWLERITAGFSSRCHAIACQTFDPATGKDRPIHLMPEKLAEACELGQAIVSKNA